MNIKIKNSDESAFILKYIGRRRCILSPSDERANGGMVSAVCEFLWVLFFIGLSDLLSVSRRACVLHEPSSRSAYVVQHVFVESVLTLGHGPEASQIDDGTDYLFIYY